MFRDLRHGISNLVRWTPIMWRDRDYDWTFLAKIMRAKLLWMAELEENHGHHTNSLRDADRQRLCAALLDRLIRDEYAEKATAHLPELEWHFEATENGMSRMVFDQEHEAERTRAYQHAAQMQKQDREMLGRIIGRHLTQWWN